MIGREYEQYLQTNGKAEDYRFNWRFWLAVTSVGFILPLVGFILRN